MRHKVLIAATLCALISTSAAAQSVLTVWDWHCDPLAPGVLGREVCYGRADFGPRGLNVEGLQVRSICDPTDRKANRRGS